MSFCDNCGSFLKRTAEGFQCPRCGKLIRSKSKARAQDLRKRSPSDIYVTDKPQKNYAKVTQICPKCGNDEALHYVSSISGEHAGIRRERTIEHFKCTRCSCSWSKSS